VNYVQLVREMAEATRNIENLEAKQLSEEQMHVFEDVRHAALRLARAAEALLEEGEP
jgi:hypothetical protein